MYALFKDGKQISKAHFTKEQCEVEAFELKVVYQGRLGRRGEYIKVMDGAFKIKEIKESGDVD